MSLRFLFVAALALGGCSNTNPGSTDSGTESGTDSAATDSGGGNDAGEAGVDGGGCSGGTVTVHDFDGWCSVSINGGASSTASTADACIALGNSFPIVVGPASASFELGPSPFVRIRGLEVPDGSAPIVTGDGGVGSTSKMIVGMSGGPGCVLVCCPFADGGGCEASFTGYSSFLTECPP